MSVVTVTITGLSEVQAALSGIVPAIRTALTDANARLEETAYQTVDDLYEPPRSPYFTIETSVNSGSGIDDLAKLSVVCAEPKVLWWEYGTPAHTIMAHDTRPNASLRFVVAGEIIFRRSVAHPGIVAHNRRYALQNMLSVASYVIWQSAVAAAITEVTR